MEKAVEAYRLSERRACRLLGLARSTWQYRSVRDSDPALRLRIRELAFERPRFGYRRIHVMLLREGWTVNHKKVLRIYREEGLQVRTKRRRKYASSPRSAPAPAGRMNERWGIDFVSDRLADSRRFRALTVIDLATRECLCIRVGQSLRSADVTEALDEVIAHRGRPESITLDNGTEFTANHFDAWAFARDIRLDFIRPGKPIENCYVESFNGSLRDECLNTHWFTSLEQAKRTIEEWRVDYNRVRPHSGIDDLVPVEYAARLLAGAA